MKNQSTLYFPYIKRERHKITHLREMNIGLLKDGHPIATIGGFPVTHIFEMWCRDGLTVIYDTCIDNGADPIRIADIHAHEISKQLCLAPLTLKEDKPLHLGMAIEIADAHYENFSGPVTFSPHIMVESDIGFDWDQINWRWTVEAKE